MRIVNRTVALVLRLVVASVLASTVAQAQSPGHLPPQPGSPTAVAQPSAPGYPSGGPTARRGLLFVPYVGFSSAVGQYSDGYAAGPLVGALLGFHIGPLFSLNGEVAVDIMKPDAGSTYNGTADRSEVFFDFSLSPLFHSAVRDVELVVGPKIGWFTFVGSSRMSDGGRGPSYTLDYDGHGIVYGVNAGAFVPIGRVSLGSILSFAGHSFSVFHCRNSGGWSCTDRPIGKKMVNVSLAMMF